ncbi:MAG: hypothetical protein JW986_06620 [Methanotrichaceae archaeon]|nr:hypothetical protein [Methanotrichaceae archaeon]
MPLESEPRLRIVGIGPGGDLITRQAQQAITEASCVVGFRPYLEMVRGLIGERQVVSTGMGREVDRAREAVRLLEEGDVALISSGDPNVYGMAGLGLEIASRAGLSHRVDVVPGVTSFAAAACAAGICFRRSIAMISLSDLLTPWSNIERRAALALELGISIAFYNPRSKKRTWQFRRVLEMMDERVERLDRNEVILARNVARPDEEIRTTTATDLLENDRLMEWVDMSTLAIKIGDGVSRGSALHNSAINLVGVGPGDPNQLTLEAEKIIGESSLVMGARRYLGIVDCLVQGKTASQSGSWPERTASRLKMAREEAAWGGRATILSGGDPSLFGSAHRITKELPVHISPGLSAFSALAARAGAPLVNDTVLLSGLDDNALPQLLDSGFAAVLYNIDAPRLRMATKIAANRPCAIARDLGRREERMVVQPGEDVRFLDGGRFTMVIGGEGSNLDGGRIITRRGYQTKYSY